MKKLWVLLLILLLPLIVNAANIQDNREWWADAHQAYAKSGCVPTLPSPPSLTFDPFACRAYMLEGQSWHGVNQEAVGFTATATDATYCLGVHRSASASVPGWTRPVFGAHYITQPSACPNSPPSGALSVAEYVVSGNVITSVSPVGTTGGDLLGTCTNAGQFETLQDAIDQAVAGDHVCVPRGVYTITGPLTIDKALTFTGYDGAVLHFPTASDATGVYITSSQVRVAGFRIIGPQQTQAALIGQSGIYAQGADASNYITDIFVEDNSISNFGYACVVTRLVRRTTIVRNELYDCYLNGVGALSTEDALVSQNKIYRIDADGVTLSGAYGITFTKNSGPASNWPLSSNATITDNDIHDVRVWTGIDVHGAFDVVVANNRITDVRLGISLGGYPDTDPEAPRRLTVTGNVIYNNHGAGEIVIPTEQDVCIGINGNQTIPIIGDNAVVDGNVCDGFGISGNILASCIQAQAFNNVVVSNNIVDNCYANGIAILSVNNAQVSNNIISNLKNTVPSVRANGTITCSGGVPNDGDTLTINTAPYTFRNSPSGVYDIQIGADANGTCTNIANHLTTNAADDGRVDATLLAFADQTGSVLITHSQWGHYGNDVLLSENAANITVSASALVAGDLGHAGISVRTLAGGVHSSGNVSHNVFSFTGAPGIGVTTVSDPVLLDFYHNRFDTTGETIIDGVGSSGVPQGSIGALYGAASVVKSIDLPSIAGGTAYNQYFAVPGASLGNTEVKVHVNRPLSGLTLSTQMYAGGYIQLQVYNQSSNPIDLVDSVFHIVVDRMRVP